MNSEEIFMHRAMELAGLGKGSVSPNPLVGCVIVHEHKVVGEGWHGKYGEAHAEVRAVNAVVDKSILTESTIYVNLEPCSHFGKTPPCADLLIRHAVKKVVVSTRDPNPVVGGKGIEKLRAAGIDVTVGLLEAEGKQLNRRFFTYIEKQRPYVILKWAQTADGFIAHANYESKWISNDVSRQWVHKWRSEEDAVLVGSQTARHDNPTLNVRHWSGRDPVRIVIDRFLKLPPDLHLFDRSQKTICYNTVKNENVKNLEFVCLEERNFLSQLVNDMYNRKIQSVIIEGGTQTLQFFVDAGLWDEARVFESTAIFQTGIPAPVIAKQPMKEHRILSDTLKIYRTDH
jgi:diaminohydroxyphosphoribosylaminopyrimidine deaminase / 5-amino-6-(5-phosphoribosylamino)uracil reductase